MTVKTWNWLFPLIVRLGAPAPLIVTLEITGGKPLASVMVLLAGKVNAMLVARPLLAALIASRSVVLPPDVSAVDVTVNVCARDGPTAPASISSTTSQRPFISYPPDLAERQPGWTPSPKGFGTVGGRSLRP